MKYFSFLLILISCGQPNPDDLISNEEQSKQKLNIQSFFDKEKLAIKVFYEDGAPPRDNDFALSNYTCWDVTEKSLESLFESRNIAVSVPKKINQMTKFKTQEVDKWESEGLIALGKSLHSGDLSIIFVKGQYKPNVVGVHFTGYPFAFVFKELIEQVGTTPRAKIYAEQATVVHELGHALGLVNNGIPLSSDHEDPDHPRHTSNKDGVMYWAVETNISLAEIIQKYMSQDKLNLFGPESIQDVQNF